MNGFEWIANLGLFEWLEIIGVTLGLLYLYFELRAHMFMWPTSIVMAVLYIGIYGHSHIYGFMTMYGYYLLMSIYGWINWFRTRAQDDGQIHQVHFMPKRNWGVVIAVIAVVFALIYGVLLNYTDGEEILLDALINAIGIVAMWMLTQKWVEQWLLLIVANILTLPLLYSVELNLTMILHAIYLIASFVGYFKWRNDALIANS